MSSFRTYGVDGGGKVFNAHLLCGGGRGATAAGDGMGVNMFPSSASNVPVEVFEVRSPSLVIAKEYIMDSPGAGKYRGSPGQRVTVSKLPGDPNPLNVFFHPNRMSFPPVGIFGGMDGTKTRVILNGEVLSDDPARMKRGHAALEKDTDRLTIEFSSGGGAYNPKERDPLLVARDVQDGLISPQQALADYEVDVASHPD
jgi:N-methylhydantoinase B/oxoprolinase/acetone carboxylase alpha subunit